MTLRRHFALLMLIAFFCWSAAPALACLSEGAMQAHHDCCAVMQTCDATMTSSCCELAPRSNTPEMVAEYSPEHHQHALPGQPSFLQSLTDSGPSHFSLNLATDPDPSPGRLSVLRI